MEIANELDFKDIFGIMPVFLLLVKVTSSSFVIRGKHCRTDYTLARTHLIDR